MAILDKVEATVAWLPVMAILVAICAFMGGR